MHVAVLGAGITGLATAWYLAEDGHRVTVVDQHSGPGLGTSYANGAQLSYSYVAPLAGPGVLPKIPPWLLRRDSPLRFYPALDPHQWRWLAAFVRACTQAQSDLTTRRLLRLSFYSRALMHAFVESGAGASVAFGYARNGKLVVHSDRAAFEAARRLVDYQASLGSEQSALDADGCRALERALADPASGLGARMVGAIFTPGEEVGDCYAFCVGIEQLMRSRGVSFVYDAPVAALRASRGDTVRRIVAFDGPGGAIEADHYVLASGAASPFLVRPLGLDLPIYPLKGYSISVPASARAPRISITDFKRKVVYAPLRIDDPGAGIATSHGELRVAGMADIAGYRAAIDPVRLEQLVAEAKSAFPNAAANHYDAGALKPWAGLRPATPKGTPILGATPIVNLFVNVGHGALGWTLALGSGRLVADTVAGRKPAIDPDGFGFG